MPNFHIINTSLEYLNLIKIKNPVSPGEYKLGDAVGVSLNLNFTHIGLSIIVKLTITPNANVRILELRSKNTSEKHSGNSNYLVISDYCH